LLAEHLGVPRAKVQSEVARARSLRGAIEALQRKEGRSLLELEDIKQWPDAVAELAAVADPEEPIAPNILSLERAGEHSAGQPDRPAWGKLALFVAVVAALTALWRFTPLAELITAERVVGWAQDFASRWWAPLVILAAYTPACVVMFPRPLITLAAVIAFGPWLGFFYAMSGIILAAVLTYYAGSHMKRDTVRRLAGPHLDRMVEVLKKHGLLAMTLLRLVPLAPFAVESIVAGAIRMKLWHVVLGTAIGLLPGTLTTTVFGDAIKTAVSGTGEVNWWIVGGALALLAGGAWAVKRWFTRMERRLSAHGGSHSPAHGEARQQPR
jgi:phospholipase D1/2